MTKALEEVGSVRERKKLEDIASGLYLDECTHCRPWSSTCLYNLIIINMLCGGMDFKQQPVVETEFFYCQ